MARAVVDEMVVKLTADVSDIEKKVKKIEKMVGMEDDSTKKSLKAEQEKVQMARQRTGMVTKAMTSTGSAIKGAMGSMLKLIGGLAIIKNVMSGVTKIIDEGRKNLYAYSKLTDGSLSKAMDKRNSAIAEFGNAFAAFEALITQALAPIITKLFEGLADIFNKIAHVVADLFDLPEYWQANMGIMKQWSTNIKENRQLLQGFDSLNITSQVAEDTPIEEMFTKVERESGDKSGFKDLFDTITKYASDAIDTVQGYITGALDLIDPSGKLTSIFDNISSTITGIIRAVFGDKFADGLEELDFKKMKEGIDDFLDETGLGGVIDSLVGFIEQLSGAISDIVNSEGFENFVTMLKSVIEVISGITKTAIDLISDLFAVFRGEKTFQDLWDDFVKNVSESVGKGVKDWLDSLAPLTPEELTSEKDNPAKKAASKPPIVGSTTYPDAGDGSLSALIANWLAGLFGKKTVQYSSNERVVFDNWTIEKKAKGGVMTSPTLAWVGEYAGASHNPEIITPQNLLDERLMANNKHLLGAINSMTNNVVNAINDISMDVMIGDETIAKSAGRGNQAWYRKTGKSLLV